MKPRLTLDNIENVFNLAKLAGSVSKSKAVPYLKRIVHELGETSDGKVKMKDIKQLNTMLKESDIMKNEKVKNADSVSIDKFNEFISYLSALADMSPHELKSGMTVKEFERWSIEKLRIELRRIQDMMYAYHSPEKFNKEISKKLKVLDYRLRNEMGLREGKKKKGKILPMVMSSGLKQPT